MAVKDDTVARRKDAQLMSLCTRRPLGEVLHRRYKCETTGEECAPFLECTIWNHVLTTVDKDAPNTAVAISLHVEGDVIDEGLPVRRVGCAGEEVKDECRVKDRVVPVAEGVMELANDLDIATGVSRWPCSTAPAGSRTQQWQVGATGAYPWHLRAWALAACSGALWPQPWQVHTCWHCARAQR